MAEFTPIETNSPLFSPPDLLLKEILKEGFGSSVYVTTQYHEGMPVPSILISLARGVGTYDYESEHRFLRKQAMRLDCLTRGPDAKDQAHNILEAADVLLIRALTESRVYPGYGNLAFLRSASRPTEVNDFATSTGAVQYASLPHDILRTEMVYRVGFRPDADQSNMTNPYLRYMSN